MGERHELLKKVNFLAFRGLPPRPPVEINEGWGKCWTFSSLIWVSNITDYSLIRNYVQLRKIIFISCNFAGVHVICET